MNLRKENLYTKTHTRGDLDYVVEMVHLPSGLEVSLAGLQEETSLPTLVSRARRLLERKVEEWKTTETPQ